MAPRTTSSKAADVSAPDADADGVDERETKTEQAPADDDKASSGTEYLNVTTGPVVYDKEGHQVDAGAWTPAINLDAIGKTARGNDYLLPRSAL